MSNDYKVRPMGADPRTSVTITDREIIYKNGLIGSDTKRLPLADARVEYSSLIRGGELIVKDHGSEVFRVGGIINPQAFYEEFDRRKSGNDPEVNTQNTPDLEQANVLVSIDRNEQIIGNKSLNKIINSEFNTFRTNWVNFIPVLGEVSGLTSKNTIIIDPEDNTARNVVMDFYHTGKNEAFAVAFLPEKNEYYSANAVYDSKAKSWEFENETIADLATTCRAAKLNFKETIRAKQSFVKLGSSIAAITLAGIFAASVAFGEEALDQDTKFTANPSEYTIQIEP